MTQMKSAGDLVFRKRMSGRPFVAWLAAATVFAIALIGGAAATQRFSLWVLLVALLPLAYELMHGYLVRASTEYRVYEDSLEVEAGIVSRKIDNIQLFRVRDIGLAQGIAGRLLNFGDIRIDSTDESSPHLVLRGVDDPRGVYESLRELVAKSQAARRTMIVEEEPPQT